MESDGSGLDVVASAASQLATRLLLPRLGWLDLLD